MGSSISLETSRGFLYIIPFRIPFKEAPMFHKILLPLFVSLLLFVSSASSQAIKVSLEKRGDSWVMLRQGAPYFVKGVGGHLNLATAKKAGANSCRTWGEKDLEAALSAAASNNLTVCAGLWVAHERHGFDYDDEQQVKEQLERFRKVVLKFKDHPNLLCWAIGNEVQIGAQNMKVWDAINGISQMIHSVDKNHPTLTVTAEINPELVKEIKARAPDLDLLGINTYGGLESLASRLPQSGWTGPFLVTEWGPNGQWESGKTSWEALLEPTSGIKADTYDRRYRIITALPQSLGSYLFLWGSKQEKTATWYDLFVPPEWSKTEIVDRMWKHWSGKDPDNRAPRLISIIVKGKGPEASVKVGKGSKNSIKVDVTDPENDALRFVYLMCEEPSNLDFAGEFTPPLQEVSGCFPGNAGKETKFKAPRIPGMYRIFVFAYDDHGNAGYGNFPFYVKE